MSGSVIGGKKAAEKNLAKNPNFYRELGRRGGSKLGVVKGFASMTHEQLVEASRKGGKISKRRKS